MTAVIFHSPFHALGSRRQTAASHRTADSFLFGHEVRVAAPSIRIVPWAALASCWPLPQQQLSVSAAGGGRCCCKPFHRPPYCPAGNRVPPQRTVLRESCQPFCGFSFYFLIFCKCFMPSSKRLRKASTSSGVLSAQKDTRMAVSIASGSRPMAASVWLG